MLREGLTQPSSDALMAEAAARIKALEDEAGELKDKWLRAEAETQNVRNRARREVEDARAYAVTKFARDVVDAAENLERALASLPPEAEGEPEIVGKLREGVAAIGRSFQGALERNGVSRHEAAGEKFDPERHQAMAEAPSPEVPAGHVIQAWTPAWTINGRLLKPAMVVVSKGAPAAADPSHDPSGDPPSGPGSTLDTEA
ncbi:MAG: nucleotide exchange factor GrpE [Acetobacteraceae bacterium]|nr:nucleotide exchange factor GrpE [Acetobacteraceae bacterium]